MTVIGTFWVTVPMSVESVTQTLYVPASIVLWGSCPLQSTAWEPASSQPDLHERERVAAVPDLHGDYAGLPERRRRS